MDSVQYGDFVSVLGHRKSPMMMQAESSLSKKPLGMRRSDGNSGMENEKLARNSQGLVCHECLKLKAFLLIKPSCTH